MNYLLCVRRQRQSLHIVEACSAFPEGFLLLSHIWYKSSLGSTFLEAVSCPKNEIDFSEVII